MRTGYWRGTHRPVEPPSWTDGLMTRQENCRVKDETSLFIQLFLLPRKPQNLNNGDWGKTIGQPFNCVLGTLRAVEGGPCTQP